MLDGDLKEPVPVAFRVSAAGDEAPQPLEILLRGEAPPVFDPVARCTDWLILKSEQSSGRCEVELCHVMASMDPLSICCWLRLGASCLDALCVRRRRNSSCASRSREAGDDATGWMFSLGLPKLQWRASSG